MKFFIAWLPLPLIRTRDAGHYPNSEENLFFMNPDSFTQSVK